MDDILIDHTNGRKWNSKHRTLSFHLLGLSKNKTPEKTHGGCHGHQGRGEVYYKEAQTTILGQLHRWYIYIYINFSVLADRMLKRVNFTTRVKKHIQK